MPESPVAAIERVSAPPAADAMLRREELRSWRTAGWLMSGGVLATALWFATSWSILWPLAAIGFLLPSLFLLTAIRARTVRAQLENGCLPAAVVGWTRAPDGCNFAVFPKGSNPTTSEPRAVVRLATDSSSRRP